MEKWIDVAPSRGRGLKLGITEVYYLFVSRPFAGAWIETDVAGLAPGDPGSPLRGGVD